LLERPLSLSLLLPALWHGGCGGQLISGGPGKLKKVEWPLVAAPRKRQADAVVPE
jgi:hypothetical protein